MKIKLTSKETSLLELFVLDINPSSKMKSVKLKFLNPDKSGLIHLSNSEYLFLLTCCEDCCEDNMRDEIIPIYESLIKQDTKDLVEVIQLTSPIL